MKDEFQFLLYKAADESISVDAVIKDETIWLTQKSMAELYGVDKSGISRHLKKQGKHPAPYRITAAGFQELPSEPDLHVSAYPALQKSV